MLKNPVSETCTRNLQNGDTHSRICTSFWYQKLASNGKHSCVLLSASFWCQEKLARENMTHAQETCESFVHQILERVPPLISIRSAPSANIVPMW